MAETDRFPYLVGRLLEQDSTLQVNSCNSGKAGNNSLHSLDILLNKVMFLPPHIVVMMHNINDLIILLFEQSYWNNNKYKSPLVEVTPSLGQNVAQSLLILRDALIPNVSRALAGLYDRFFVTARPTEFPAVQGKTVKIEPSRLLRDFRANLEIFIDICRRRHIIPVLMTQANRFTDAPDTFIASMMRRLEIQHGITYKDFKTIFDLFNQEIRAAGQASQVLVIDLARQIPPEKAYLYDTVHLTARGSRLASEIISQNLQSVVRNLRTKKNTSTQPD
jgi:hypothetical protein